MHIHGMAGVVLYIKSQFFIVLNLKGFVRILLFSYIIKQNIINAEIETKLRMIERRSYDYILFS